MTDETKKKIGNGVSKYKKEYPQEIVAYFERCLTEKRGTRLKEIPSYVGFARRIGATERTVANWRKRYPRFDEACAECDAMFIAAVIAGALQFDMHASFAKFLLSSRYGFKEKVELSRDENDLVEVTDEVKRLLTKRAGREEK